MDNRILAKADKKLQAQRRRKIWQRAVAVLGSLVVIATVYALTLPGVTLEEEVVCGKEEHIHTEACYTEQPVLVCGQEEVPAHSHSPECYEAQQTLLCGQEESEEHTHSDSCYGTEEILTCGQEETAGHAHTEECYQPEQQLTCEMEEHSHGEACYAEKPVEPSPSPIRAGDPSADVESRSDWEQTVANVELTGRWDKDVLAIAKSQLDYQESSRNYVVQDNRILGYTRYGEWYGNAYGDWCAMFVSFCLNYAKIPEEAIPYEAGCTTWVTKLKEKNMFAPSGEYTPEPGDLIFFDWDFDNSIDHVGLVYTIEKEGAGPAVIKTIEGNSSDSVQYVKYEMDESCIYGYGILPENPNLDEPEDTPEDTPEETQDAENDVVLEALVETEGPDIMLFSDAGEDEFTDIGSFLQEAGILIDGKEYVPGMVLKPGSEFVVSLKWDMTRSDLNGNNECKYRFPEEILVQNVENAPLYDGSGAPKGRYSIRDGVLTVVYFEASDKNETTFTIAATWNQDKINQSTNINWGNGLNTEVKFDISQVSVTKKCHREDNPGDGSYIREYMATVTASGDVGAVTLKDKLESEYFHFVQGYYDPNPEDKDGEKYDFRYKIPGDDAYHYGNFPEGTFDSNGRVATEDGMVVFPLEENLGKGQSYFVEYAVQLDAEAREKLDAYQLAANLTNTAEASYTHNDDTISSSVTVNDTYRAEHKWVIKEQGKLTEGDVHNDTDIPWTVVVNKDRNYDMGGTVIGDQIGTPGVIYKTDTPLEVTTKTDSSSKSMAPEWVVLPSWGNMSSNQVLQTIRWMAQTDALGQLFTNPEYVYARQYLEEQIAQCTGKKVTLTEELMSDYVFVNEEKNEFIWITPKTGTPTTYQLNYITDASGSDSSVLANSASAGWKSWESGDTVGSFVQQQVKLEKKNDGVRKTEDGYFVDWNITVEVPAGGGRIDDVYLYDELPCYWYEGVVYRDWLQGLGDEFDYARYENEDMAYLSELAQPAFKLTTNSEDPVVQSIVNEAAAALGHPIDGLGNDDFEIYDGDKTSLAQMGVINAEDTEYAEKRVSFSRFGVFLGTLPVTQEGYTINLKYTTRVNPAVIEQLDGKVSAKNVVHLRQHNEAMTEDIVLAETESEYWVTHTQAEHSLDKSIVNYDPETRTLTYQVLIDPDINLASKLGDYTLTDVLSIPGAQFVEDSFALSFLGTLADGKFTYNAGKQTLLWSRSYQYLLEQALGYQEKMQQLLKSVQEMEKEYSNSSDPERRAELLKEYQAAMEQYQEYDRLFQDLYEQLQEFAKENSLINEIAKVIDLTVTNQQNGSSRFVLNIDNAYRASEGSDPLAWATVAEPQKYAGKFLPMALTYQVRLPETTEGAAEEEIENAITLRYQPEDGESELLDTAETVFDYSQAMHKWLVKNPSGTNNYTASFVVAVDATMEQLKGKDKFTVVDTMSKTLQVAVNNVKVYAADEGGEFTLLETGYTVGYDDKNSSTSNVLSVEIENKHDRYRIEYDAHVSGTVGSYVDYQNTATVKDTNIVSETVKEEVVIRDEGADVVQTNYLVKLYKFAAENTEQKLQATFELYSYNSDEGEWVGPFLSDLTTDEETGELLLDNSNYEYDKELLGREFLLDEHIWYKLVETEVPAGYLPSTTYFHIGQVEADEVKPDEVGANYSTILADGVNIIHQIPNYKASLRIRKADEANHELYLSGAVFKLYTDEKCETEELLTAVEEEDANGRIYTFALENLEPDTPYYLKETKAPDGYKCEDAVYQVTFDEQGNVTVKDSDGNILPTLENAYLVLNARMYELPKTGGSGTLLYTLGGIALVLTALAYIGVKRRKRQTCFRHAR